MATPNSLPILYSFRRCPYAMRARLALYVSSINVELREIVLRDKPKQMLDISPKGTVPALQLPNMKVIDESLEIMIYALNFHDPYQWLGIKEQTTQNLITRNDNEFKYALDRYKYPDRYPNEDCSKMFERGAKILKDLNARIEAHGALVDKNNTLADYAIFPFIRQFAATNRERFDALKLKPLERWIDQHISRILFKSIMGKHAPWEQGKAPIMFGQKT